MSIESNKKKVGLGDGVLDTAKTQANDRLGELAKIAINLVFDYLDEKVKNLPETIKRLRNDPETEKELISQWSEHLYENTLIPQSYKGLSDELLIHNFRQEGYLDGLFAGHVITMESLVDNNISSDMCVAITKSVLPNLIGHSYEDRGEYKEKYDELRNQWNAQKAE